MPTSMPAPHRDCLVVFSPLPPLENGIADYAAELMPLLAAARDVVVVIDDHAPEPPAHAAYTSMRLADYVAREVEFERTPHLYQIGNNADHVYLLPWLLRRPGVVVLHDVSLHHLIDQATLRFGDLDGYCAMLELEYGAPGRVLSSQFREYGWRSRSMFYEMPLTREILGRARAVIVHSLYAANKVAAQQDGVPVKLVRHHVAHSAATARTAGARESARAELGIADDTVLLVSLGFITRAKQTEAVLRFLHRHRATLPPIRYVLAGQDSPQDFDVRSLIANVELQDIVTITGYVDEKSFYRHIAASDIVVNLRYPSGGETSGTLIRALGAGACIVVNDIGSFSEYPDDVCAKVPVDAGVADADFDRVMLPLIASPARRRRLSERARDYMRQTHSIQESARRYLQVLKEHGKRSVLPLAERSGRGLLPASLREALLRELPPDERRCLPLWVTEGAVPCCMDQADRVLLVGGAGSHATHLNRLFGYRPTSIDVLPTSTLPAATPRRSHQVAMLDMELVHCRERLVPTLQRLNARLTFDGQLLLTIVEHAAAVSSDTVVDASRALEGCGFVIEQVVRSRETLSFALDAQANDRDEPPDGDAVLIRVRKNSEFASGRAAFGVAGSSHAAA
jgi:glycosyltransferase involved in cell wall biosynthesis